MKLKAMVCNFARVHQLLVLFLDFILILAIDILSSPQLLADIYELINEFIRE